MTKQLYFILGLFIASIFSILIYFGLARITEDQIRDSIAYFFIATSFIFLCLIILMLCRDRILRFLNIKVTTKAEDVVSITARTIGDALSGNTQAVKENSEEFAKIAVSWYAWTSFYRWVIGTAIALLVAFAGLAGTALFIEQNRRLETQNKYILNQNELIQNQNDIQSVLLAENLRAPFLNEPTLSDSPGIFRGEYQAESCKLMGSPDIELYRSPNGREVDVLVSLGEKKSIGDHVKKLLVNQLQDSNPTAALGALMALDRLGAVPKKASVTLRRISIGNLKIKAPVTLNIIESSVGNLDCKKCTLLFRKSTMLDPYDTPIEYMIYSHVDRLRPENVKEPKLNAKFNLVAFNSGTVDYEFNLEASKAFLRKNVTYSVGNITKSLSGDNTPVSCEAIRKFCTQNPFIECSGLE